MTLNDKLAQFLIAHQGEWIDGMRLAEIAGCYAWRSRCSDLRKRGMVIENRQRSIEGKRVVSEYRYCAPKGQMELSL